MTPEQMIQHMLDLQDELNKQIHPQWREQDYPWHRAIWMECAELMDHLGWKWWSAEKTLDPDQVKLELVDIWHFVLSDCLQGNKDVYAVSVAWGHPLACTSLQKSVEALAGRCAFDRRAPVEVVSGICALLGLTLPDLYALYLGKQALNRFRQDHGYKDGTYEKVWFGEEDNRHLAAIVNNSTGVADFGSEAYQKMIYGELVCVYERWFEESRP